MTIRGFVDGLVGSAVSGWAVAQPDTRSCTVEVRDAAGRVVGRGRAARQRTDLLGLGLGRANFGFRVPVAGLGDSPRLHVLADGVELPGSPVATGRGLFDGVAVAADGMVEGWVAERVEGFAPPAIRVLDQDGAVVAEGASVAAGAADPVFAPARFCLRLHPSCYGRPELHLTVLADGVAFARAAGSLALTGFLDDLTPDRCAGWLLSPDAPATRFDIEVFRDGVLVGAGRTMLPRDDLRELHPQAWKVGFDIALRPPAHDDPTRASTYSVRLADAPAPSRRELFDGPFLIGHRIAMVTAARGAARLAHLPGLSDAERTVLQAALAAFMADRRHGETTLRLPQTVPPPTTPRRLSVVVPVYRGVEVTRACIQSVLAHRGAGDALVLVDDRSPDADMAAMLEAFVAEREVVVLSNPTNLGFVGSVNRALAFCRGGDVVLLNSDTRMFAGGLDELWRAAHSSPGIGTATALSNNATIFSYPHPLLATASLPDASWEELAAVALAENEGMVADVPTGHGFCMLVRRELLDRVGHLNPVFGRGYGEENELCLRAQDLGWRHVAACGVLVEHRESVSFEAEKALLLRTNMPQLEAMYPEYSPTVMAWQRTDGLRRARWALDAHRLRRASASGRTFVLVVENWLGGGTRKAVAEIGEAVGYGPTETLRLSCTATGTLQLEAGQLEAGQPEVGQSEGGQPEAAGLVLRAVFQPEESGMLIELLSCVPITLVLMHQALGFGDEFLSRFGSWAAGRRAVFYLHDFYPACPRVTMIDAVGEYCDVADTTVCARCVALDGAHEASRLVELSPERHRALFARLLGQMSRVVAPSHSAAGLLLRAFPALKPAGLVSVLPHPEPAEAYPAQVRQGSDEDVLLLGAIGPHKGSGRLLELARRAALTHPRLRFHVIGHTDIDSELRKLGNVQVTGPYEKHELHGLVAAAGGRLALFLHGWPETFSYTLSEAVQLGLVPLVPDIGAPAERVRAAGFGVVFPFPIEPAQVLETIAAMVEGRLQGGRPGAGPSAFRPAPGLATRMQQALVPELVAAG